MSLTQRCRDKRVVFEALMERGIAALHLDPRHEGVRVPEHLKGRPWIVLNFSRAFRLDDLSWDDAEARASLSFAGQPFPCRVPWTAVFAITNDARDAGYAWSDEMPPLLADAMARAQADRPGTDALRLIEGGASGPGSAPRRGHLRRVK